MSTTELRVAAVQLEAQDRLEENLERAFDLVRRAAAAGAELVLLPENFAFMGSESDKRAIAEVVTDAPSESDGPIVAFLRKAAREANVHLIGGGMPERSDDAARPFNTSVVVEPGGRVVGRYRKIHLFDVEVGDGQLYRESASTSAGDAPSCVDVGGVRVGLSVCYDLRFPELYRALVDLGAQLLTVPAAFTLATGKDHWMALLRARAIESQCWVLAAGQWGTHPKGRRTYGKSCLIDPWGDVVAQASEGVGIVVGAVELARLESIRSTLPALSHRRLSVAAPSRPSGA
jgi:predicted amidohydrolase